MSRMVGLLLSLLIVGGLNVCEAQGPVVASSYNTRMVMADQQPSLGACLGSGNQVCVAIANYSTTLTTPLTISASYTTLQCYPGATINIGPSGMIIITGAHVTISGCTFSFTGGGSFIPAAIVIENGATYTRIEKNVFKNFAGPAGNCIVYAPDRTALTNNSVSFVWIEDNMFESTNTNVTDICAYDYVDHLWIENNWTDFSGATLNGTEGIIVHAQDANTIPSFVTIANNKGQGATGNCVEVQGLVNKAPTNIAVTGNQCQLTGTTATGAGFSLSNVQSFVYSNNLFNANGFNLGTGNPPLECVDCVNGAIGGNTINVGPQSASATPYGVIAVGASVITSNVSVVGNTVTAAYTGSGYLACYASSISTSGTIKSINYSGNLCDLTGSTGNVAGIWFQCNNSLATCTTNFASGNILIGANTSVDGGIVLERDSGTMQHNIVGINHVFNFHTPFSQSFGSPTTGFCSGCVDAAIEPSLFTILSYH